MVEATAKAQIGVTGLAVMGRNLARNFDPAAPDSTPNQHRHGTQPRSVCTETRGGVLPRDGVRWTARFKHMS